MLKTSEDLTSSRLISRVLSMYYLENVSQVEISRRLGLSTAKVNRLIKQARSQGMVEVNLHIPFQNIFELERQIEKTFGVKEAVVVPRFALDDAAALQSAGQAAARYLLDHLRDGDVVCMGGGRALLELVRSVRTERTFDVRVVPAIGGVQGRHYTDVNYLAAELANRLGGAAYQLHAPAFVDSRGERDSILVLRQVEQVLELARRAQIALVGIGSLIPDSASYFQFTSLPQDEVSRIATQEGGAGEILARIFDGQGHSIASEYSQRVVGLGLDELREIPLAMGVAATAQKAPAIAAALEGRLVNVIVADEEAGDQVLSYASAR